MRVADPETGVSGEVEYVVLSSGGNRIKIWGGDFLRAVGMARKNRKAFEEIVRIISKVYLPASQPWVFNHYMHVAEERGIGCARRVLKRKEREYDLARETLSKVMGEGCIYSERSGVLAVHVPEIDAVFVLREGRDGELECKVVNLRYRRGLSALVSALRSRRTRGWRPLSSLIDTMGPRSLFTKLILDRLKAARLRTRGEPGAAEIAKRAISYIESAAALRA